MRHEPEDFGISRMDQPDKGNHGWYVKIRCAGEHHRKYFADNLHGGRDATLTEARKFRDELVASLPKEVQDRAKRPPRESPKSGVPGIYYAYRKAGGKEYEGWEVCYQEKGRSKRKWFGIKTHGIEEALKKAKAWKRIYGSSK